MVEWLIAFVVANYVDIIVIGMFLIASYILLVKGYKQKVAMMCLFLVNVAEEKFGSGTGQIKYEFVETHLYETLPKVIRFFLTADDIDNAIEKAVDGLQEWLDKESKGE